jgi:hypothetical protein
MPGIITRKVGYKQDVIFYVYESRKLCYNAYITGASLHRNLIPTDENWNCGGEQKGSRQKLISALDG